jgi:hypothetical protein
MILGECIIAESLTDRLFVWKGEHRYGDIPGAIIAKFREANAVNQCHGSRLLLYSDSAWGREVEK